MVLRLGNLVPHPRNQLPKRCNSTRNNKIILPLNLLSPHLSTPDILQTHPLRNIGNHLHLLPNRINQRKPALRKHNRQRHPGKTSTRTHIQHLRHRLKPDNLRYRQRVQHMMLVEINHIPTRNHINPRIPLLIQRPQRRQLLPLPPSQLRKISDNPIHHQPATCYQLPPTNTPSSAYSCCSSSTA